MEDYQETYEQNQMAEHHYEESYQQNQMADYNDNGGADYEIAEEEQTERVAYEEDEMRIDLSRNEKIVEVEVSDLTTDIEIVDLSQVFVRSVTTDEAGIKATLES